MCGFSSDTHLEQNSTKVWEVWGVYDIHDTNTRFPMLCKEAEEHCCLTDTCCLWIISSRHGDGMTPFTLFYCGSDCPVAFTLFGLTVARVGFYHVWFFLVFYYVLVDFYCVLLSVWLIVSLAFPWVFVLASQSLDSVGVTVCWFDCCLSCWFYCVSVSLWLVLVLLSADLTVVCRVGSTLCWFRCG